MSDRHVHSHISQAVGFAVEPGTLNVRLPEPLDRSPLVSYLAGSEIDPGWAAETGQDGYFWCRVLIAGRYQGIVARPDEPDYPDDLIELLCEVHLRRTLELSDGDSIGFALVS